MICFSGGRRAWCGVPPIFELLPGGFWLGVALVLGACVGSFLNVAIYRLPRGMRVDRPQRSFCPHCGREISAWRNLPVLTWLLQGGKAACCGRPISARYLVVELLTALLFALAWWRLGWPVGLVVLPWLALLVVGSAIDLEHLLLPDVVTLGGLGLGLAASALVPELHQQLGWWPGLRASLLGAGGGLLLLALVWQGGKLAFGRLKLELEAPEVFVVEERGERIGFGLGADWLDWDEVFSRRSDVLRVEAMAWRALDEEGAELATGGAETLLLRRAELQAGPRRWELEQLARITGTARRVVVPREAMGFGDVLLVGMIGAWCGWQGAVFALGAGAILGLGVGLPLRLFGARSQRNFQLPFGPFLAAAAILWMFGGRECWADYASVFEL